jgi:glucose-1-phosphate adenylyltransferase
MMHRHECPPARGICRDTLAVVMAGGNGNRLGQLTRWHAKPALPFGGHYRNVDFALSNCVNSGIRRIGLLTQYKAHSLIQHIYQGWSFLRPEVGEFIELWPAQQRTGKHWYVGTADAVYQNIDIITGHRPKHVLILAGDHVYTMDYLAMLEEHVRTSAAITIGSVEVPIEAASAYGVLGVDVTGRVVDFAEKPVNPRSIPNRPDAALISMGIYVFSFEALVEALTADAANVASSHDFGHDVLPAALGRARVQAHAFRDPDTGTPRYWRDVGTVDSYWQANMDLLLEDSPIDLHDHSWPIWTSRMQYAPATLARSGSATESIVAAGCRVEGTVRHSVLFTDAHVCTRALVEDSLVLPGATIGRGARVRQAIIDSGCVVPDGAVIGDGAAHTRFYVSPHGVTLCATEDIEAMLAVPDRRDVA